MKSIEDVVAELARRLDRSWAQTAAGLDVAWNPAVSLQAPSGVALAADFAAGQAWSRRWTSWAASRQLELSTATRKVGPTFHPFPTTLLVPDQRTAAELVGGPWPTRLALAAARTATLRAQFAHLVPGAELTRLVRETTVMSDLDFELLQVAGHWFAEHDATGLTPRQVPIAGMHAKWLNTSQHLVAILSGRESLNLAPSHPPVVHLTYLDPDHLAGGGRRHDAHAVGDHVSLPYPVRIVLISENKDTAVMFEPVPGAVAVQGQGTNVAPVAALPWVRAAQHVVYWGDMDADGLEILGLLRATGLGVTSMLMDTDAYARWCRFGANHDRFGRLLAGRSPREGLTLTDAELALYRRLCEPTFTGYRRVEQERIPLPYARVVLARLVNRGGPLPD